MTITDVGAMPVATFAAEVVARVASDADLWDVAEEMIQADVGALAVDTGDGVSGIVSERDLVRALAARRDPATTKALDIASTRLVWCDAESTVAEVAEEMMARWVRHVLVEEEGRVVGIVSARDLLGAYAAAESPDED
jgi:CBS domain-containing protein